MSKYTISVSEEDLLKYTSTPGAKQELLDKLKELDSKYVLGFQDMENIPKTLGLEKLEYVEASDDELKKKAEDKLIADFQKELENLEKTYASKNESLKKEKENAVKEADMLSKELEGNYADAKQSLENNALKRGLARSSIVMNQLEGLDRAATESKNAIAMQKSETIADIDKRIASLSEELDKAISDSNAAYAVNLSREIDSLKSEQQARLDEVTKYNNTVNEKEADYAIEREQKVSDLIDKQLSSTNEESVQRKEYEKARIVRDFLDGMSKEAALAYLTGDEDVKKAAGDYYSYLYNYILLRDE